MSNRPQLGDLGGGTWSVNVNGCEHGVLDGVFLEDFFLDPDKGLWEGFWLEIPYGPVPLSRGAW